MSVIPLKPLVLNIHFISLKNQRRKEIMPKTKSKENITQKWGKNGAPKSTNRKGLLKSLQAKRGK